MYTYHKYMYTVCIYAVYTYDVRYAVYTYDVRYAVYT